MIISETVSYEKDSVAIKCILCVCISSRIFQRHTMSRNSSACCLVAVARSFSGDVAIRYVLPVVRMTSCNAIGLAEVTQATV